MVVNVHEAKTHLSRLLERVSAGEEIVIARAGQPVARLIAYQANRPVRVPDTYRGQVWVAEDFNAPLPEDVLASFEE